MKYNLEERTKKSAAGARLYLAPHVSKQKKQGTTLLLHLDSISRNGGANPDGKLRFQRGKQKTRQNSGFFDEYQLGTDLGIVTPMQ